MTEATPFREAPTSNHRRTHAPGTPVLDTAVLDRAEPPDPAAHLAVAHLPRSPDLLGCRFCGLPAREHGPHLIHRFLRPVLPDGHHYLDQVPPGDHVSLRTEAFGQVNLVVEETDRATTSDDGLLLLHSPRHDCDFLLHPSTVVVAVG